MNTHPISLMSDEAFGWYFSGLTDGEGCFHFRCATRWLVNGSARPSFQGMLNISMRDDDTPGITAIRNRLGVGRLYPDLAASRHGKGNPQIKFEVCKADSLANVIIPHFDKFPLALKKARDFTIWREAVLVWHASTLRKLKGKAPSASAFGPRSSRLADHEVNFLLESITKLKSGRKYQPFTHPPILLPP